MKNWTIDNGTLLLCLRNDNRYHPKALDIYEQKDNDTFVHEGLVYAPLSETKLRFSGLSAHVKPIFSFSQVLKLDLCLPYRGTYLYVSKYNKVFNDYIIYDNIWKYIDPFVESINSTLNAYNINPDEISFKQYILLLNEFKKIGIEVTDGIIETINEIKKSADLEIPLGLKADLYPYQSSGAKWIDFMVRQKCGSLLGDEMGLGKTLQIITVMGLLKERKKDAHFLVVCPVSLLENWRREIAKFYPSFTTNIHYGDKRTGDYRELYKFDVNIMSYSCTITDGGLLTMTKWDLLVIDEAQNIKNPEAKRTKAIKSINCEVPIAVTGTPFENHMTDIWSIIDFIMPKFLGSLRQFNQNFTDDMESATTLEKLITPLILRRQVKDVAKDLPNRIDIPQSIIMSEEEARLYEDSRQTDNPYEELKNMQLEKIQKLRTFCTHPYVYDKNYIENNPTAISTKYSRLCEILEEIFETNEKVVIFTSFRRMIDLMYKDIKERFNVYTNFIDGSVDASERQKSVDEFSSIEGAGVLILNPKAAGVGLNITCANHAIHYNLEWNPAIEDQASARIYRRGQNKTVFIYRLYYANTIEEIINERIQIKRQLSDNTIIGNNGDVTEQEFLIKALSVSPFKTII